MTAVIGPVGLSREPSDYEGGGKVLTWSKKRPCVVLVGRGLSMSNSFYLDSDF